MNMKCGIFRNISIKEQSSLRKTVFAGYKHLQKFLEDSAYKLGILVSKSLT